MMNCAECQKRIAAYVDAELPPAEMEAVRSHAQTCAGCASSALASLERKLAIRRAGLRYSAPPELRGTAKSPVATLRLFGTVES